MESLAILNAFLLAWTQCQWEEMFKLTQKTWTDGRISINLEEKLSRNPVSFKVISYTNLGNVRQEAKVELTFSDGEIVMIRAIMVCESAPYSPAAYGDWGVNPVSVLNVLEQIKKPNTAKSNEKSKKKDGV